MLFRNSQNLSFKQPTTPNSRIRSHPLRLRNLPVHCKLKMHLHIRELVDMQIHLQSNLNIEDICYNLNPNSPVVYNWRHASILRSILEHLVVDAKWRA